MVLMGWSQTYTGTVIEPETTSFRLLLGNLKPLLTPYALNMLVIDLPSFAFQKNRDATISVTSVSAGETDDLSRQHLFIFVCDRRMSLGGAGLSN